SGAIREACERVQRSLDLKRGPMMRLLWMETGEEGGEGACGRLLVVAHHLVVDGVSWRILLEDLERAYSQAEAGAVIELGPKTSSYRRWAEALVREAEGGLPDSERRYWLDMAKAEVLSLPEGNGSAVNDEGSARSVHVVLSEERTGQLLQEVPSVYNTQINDLLLTALARTLSWWCSGAGAGSGKNGNNGNNGAGAGPDEVRGVLVDVEGHGREEIADGLDLSRTVGWFTSIFPVVLSGPEGEARGEAIKRV